MKELKAVQILLPSVTLGAVLSMSGIASASQTEYVRTKVPGATASGHVPSDNGNGEEEGDGKKKNDNIDIDIDINIDAGSNKNGDDGNG